jgi:hypothetical protein
MNDWKQELEPFLQMYINELIKESKKHRKAYLKAQNPYLAQMWVAMAILNKKIKVLEERVKILEHQLNKKGNILDDLKKL